MPTINRTQKEIDDLLNRCVDSENEGSSEYPGMTYEQGIRAGIEWLLGETNDYPFD